jgi:DNA-binding NtrC family response regulator
VEDIPLLVNWFVSKVGRRLGKTVERVEKTTIDSLKQYPWPGNVRELENVIERALITSHGPTLKLTDKLDTVEADETMQRKTLAEIERDHILQALESCHWRIEGENGAANLLGLNASTLRARLRKHGIKRP